MLVVLVLGIAPVSSPFTPDVALAQSDLSADPKAVSPTVNDLRSGFQFVPEKSEQREPVPGIIVYEADFVRDQTKANFANGPIEIKSLVAKTANASQAAEQFASSRQALTTASPAWVESKVAKLGDEATGLTMEGTSGRGAGRRAPVPLPPWRDGRRHHRGRPDEADPDGRGRGDRRRRAPQDRPVVQEPDRGAPGAAVEHPAAGGERHRPQHQRPAGVVDRVRPGSGCASPTPAGLGVRLRLEPSLKGQIVGRLADGTVLEIVGEDKQADGYTWKNVRAPGDGRGWVAAELPRDRRLAASGAAPSTGPGGEHRPGAEHHQQREQHPRE